MYLCKYKYFKLVMLCIVHSSLYMVALYCSADINTEYSKKISVFSNYTSQKYSLIDSVNNKDKYHAITISKPNVPLNFKSSITKKKVGSFLYKAASNPNRLVYSAAVSTIYSGLEIIGLSKSVKAGVDYIEKKIKYNFGQCSQVRFTNKIKVGSCLNDRSSLELLSDYNINSVSINFRWSL